MSERAQRELILNLLHHNKGVREIHQVTRAVKMTICWVKQLQMAQRTPTEITTPARVPRLVAQVHHALKTNLAGYHVGTGLLVQCNPDDNVAGLWLKILSVSHTRGQEFTKLCLAQKRAG